ncbi:hypothetical protein IFVP182_C240006 [Vibrio parahaemolyticus]
MLNTYDFNFNISQLNTKNIKETGKREFLDACQSTEIKYLI